MKLGIMQPYFFPYLGYYSLIKKTDEFILFDTVQFIRHGWIERNRILKPVEDWQYVAVPLEKKTLSTVIRELEIRSSEDWKGKLIRQLEHYRKRAPFFRETLRVVEDSLSINTTSIVKLNQNILKKTCAYFKIPLKISIFSEMNLAIDDVTDPGEWALQISKVLKAEEYFNPTGGMDIFDPAQFDSAGIALRFLGNNLKPYSQRRQTFEAGLSIIDVMMFNDVERINSLIDDTYLVSPKAKLPTLPFQFKSAIEVQNDN
jgi:WbqC-like protein family